MGCCIMKPKVGRYEIERAMGKEYYHKTQESEDDSQDGEDEVEHAMRGEHFDELQENENNPPAEVGQQRFRPGIPLDPDQLTDLKERLKGIRGQTTLFCALIAAYPMDTFQDTMANLNGGMITPVLTTKLGELGGASTKLYFTTKHYT